MKKPTKTAKILPKIKDLIYPIASRIIIEIKNAETISEIQKKTNHTWSHTFMIIKVLEREKFIETEKIGRIRSIKLTKKGNQLNDILVQLRNVTK